MAREVKIKVKNENGDFEFRKIEFPPETEVEGLEKTLKKSEFKFSDKGNQKTKVIRETREYELITPLFGGGAITKKADEVSIVRATEIRGHLRFWWRATRGGQFSNIEDLKKAEDAIFGSTEKHSALKIEVVLEEDYQKREEENGKKKETLVEVKMFKNKEGKTFPKSFPTQKIKELQYVAFPLQPNESEKKQIGWKAEIANNIKFKVVISYPQIKVKINHIELSIQNEIQSALWAWENFGGIGARTRRGFGALKLTKKNGIPQTDEMFVSEESLNEKADKYIYGGMPPKGIPYLNKNLRFVVISEKSDAAEVWKKLIDTYKAFRQQRIGTGRSKWNEPEVIRNLTGQRLKTSKPEDSHPSQKPDFEKFPRAEFGLPIVFQFHFEDTWKNRKVKSDDKNVDPRKTILKVSDIPSQNLKRERFSSPLILRPVACQNGKFVGIALILKNETTLDELGLTLEAQEHPKVVIKTRLKSKLDGTTKEHEQIKAVDGSNLLSKADVLQAFLDYLENLNL